MGPPSRLLAVVTLVLVLATACTSSPESAGGSASPFSTAAGPPTTCEVGLKEQHPPDATSRGQITRILVDVYPEGVPAIVEEGSHFMTPRMTNAFEEAKTLIPEALPAVLSQSCCSGGSYVRIDFANGYVMYGPCKVPAVINKVRWLVQAAAYARG